MCGYVSDFTMDETIEGIWKNIELYPSHSSSSDVVQFKNASCWRHWRCHQVVQHWPTMDKFISQHWRKKSERKSKHQNLGSAKLDVILVNYFQIAIANNCAVVIFTLKDKTKRWF